MLNVESLVLSKHIDVVKGELLEIAKMEQYLNMSLKNCPEFVIQKALLKCLVFSSVALKYLSPE